MEKRSKKIGIVLISLVFILIMVILIFTLLKTNNQNNPTNSEEGYKVNNNENVIKEQEVGSFRFTNTSLNYIEGNSVLRVSVTNITNEEVRLQEFKIHVYDNERNEIVTLTGFVGDKVSAGETKFIECSYADDLTNAESIEYEIID